MTKIKFKQRGNKYTVEAKGHATGSEIACAGVSAVMYALAGYLINAERAGKVYDVSGHLKPADAVQEWCGGEAAEAAYEMATIGLMQIAESYPQYVKIAVDNSFLLGAKSR